MTAPLPPTFHSPSLSPLAAKEPSKHLKPLAPRRNCGSRSGIRSALFLVLLLTMTSSHAGLILNVTGTPGSGTTTWSFSGFSKAQFTGTVPSFNRNLALNSWLHDAGDLSGEWRDDGDSDFLDKQHAFTSSTAQASGAGLGGATLDIDRIFLNTDPAAGDDDFAIIYDVDAPSVQGGVITYSGSGVLALDITKFGTGANAIVNIGDTFTLTSNSESIGSFQATLTATAVPEPSAAVLAAIPLSFIVWRRRRRRTRMAK